MDRMQKLENYLIMSWRSWVCQRRLGKSSHFGLFQIFLVNKCYFSQMVVLHFKNIVKVLFSYALSQFSLILIELELHFVKLIHWLLFFSSRPYDSCYGLAYVFLKMLSRTAVETKPCPIQTCMLLGWTVREIHHSCRGGYRKRFLLHHFA